MATQTAYMPPPRQDSRQAQTQSQGQGQAQDTSAYRRTPPPVAGRGPSPQPQPGQSQQAGASPSRRYSSNANSPSQQQQQPLQSQNQPRSHSASASQAYASQIQQQFSPVDINNVVSSPTSNISPTSMIPIRESDQPSRQYSGAGASTGGIQTSQSFASGIGNQGQYAQTMSMYGGGKDFGQSMGPGYAGSVYGMSTVGGPGGGGGGGGGGPRRQGTESVVGMPGQPILDNSHLKPGASAALLSHDKTLELYRANAKKTNDPELIFEFAVFMIDAAKSIDPSISSSPFSPTEPGSSPANPTNPHSTVPASQVAQQKRDDLIKESISLLKRLADRGHPDAQYFLADCYANGIGTVRGKQDFDRAFPLFVLSAKHRHPDASYRAGTCCEHGWGCRRESAKAIQFYKKAAAALHPGAMYRLGTAELNGSLGLAPRPKEGVKWLKRSAEHATPEFPHALHELALLHERGIENVLFVDLEYASELLAQASELGYAPSAFKLGECYEYAKMGCPMDAALSIHYYNIAAQQDHRDGCFALTAWYLVGSPGVLPQSDTEAFLWAKKAAEMGLAKAQYAVGYFTEVGIGTPASPQNAIQWYKLAAEQGDKRADKRLKNFSSQSIGANAGAGRSRGELLAKGMEGGEGDGDGKEGKDGCLIM